MVGDNIRSIRKLLKMTQADLAKRLCLKVAAVSKYETNTVIPSVEQCKKIASVLQVPVTLIIADDISGIDNENLTNIVRDMQTSTNKELESFSLSKSNRYMKKLSEYTDQLNETGQKRLLSMAKDFVEISRYTEKAK